MSETTTGGRAEGGAPGPARWRKRPVVVEAIQWTGANLAEVLEFCGGGYFGVVAPEDRAEDPDMTAEVYDKLHGTWVHVYDGQWVIRGVKSELYPCAADVFAGTYEPAGAEPLVPSANETDALWTIVGRLGIAGTLRALAAFAVGDDTGQPPSGAPESPQPRTGASEPEPSLGEVLHRARQAGGAGRPRPWPVEDWADRHRDLRALDEAMAETVAAVVRERDGAKLERLRKLGVECRRLASDGYPALASVASDILAITGVPQERSDGKESP